MLIGVEMLTLNTRQFFIFNVPLVIAWLGFTLMLIREYGKAEQAVTSTAEEFPGKK